MVVSHVFFLFVTVWSVIALGTQSCWPCWRRWGDAASTVAPLVRQRWCQLPHKKLLASPCTRQVCLVHSTYPFQHQPPRHRPRLIAWPAAASPRPPPRQVPGPAAAFFTVALVECFHAKGPPHLPAFPLLLEPPVSECFSVSLPSWCHPHFVFGLWLTLWDAVSSLGAEEGWGTYLGGTSGS